MPSGLMKKPSRTFEVSCGGCGGRLRVATPGEPVGCPHCGLALAVPTDEAALAGRPVLDELPEEPGSSIFTDAPLAAAECDRAAAIGPAGETNQTGPAAEPGASPLAPTLSSLIDRGSGADHGSRIGSALSADHEEAGSRPDFSAWGEQPDRAEQDRAETIEPGEEEPSGEVFAGEPPSSPWLPAGEASLGAGATPTDPRSGVTGDISGPAGKSGGSEPVPVDTAEATLPADDDSVTADEPPPADWGAEAAEAGGPDWPSTVSLPFVALPRGQEDAAEPFDPGQFNPAQFDPAQFGSAEEILAATGPGGWSPASRLAQADDPRYVPRLLFRVAVMYGSIATAVVLFLLYLFAVNQAHQLESLPDTVLPRVNRNGTVQREVWPETASMPPGHELALGQSVRLGDLKVTPLAVTGGSAGGGGPLKLWLKLQNVSESGRSFVPLDGSLIYYRQTQRRGGFRQRANTFLATADHKARTPAKLVFMDDPFNPDGPGEPGQNLGRELAPGESVVSFIPSESDPPPLSGDLGGPLSWRVHLRKGIASGGYGVTTLVEVDFTPDQVTSQEPTA